MGNKSAKKTNQLLGQQTALNNQAATTFGDRSQQEYDYRTGTRDKIGNEYWNLYSDVGSGGGGGGMSAPQLNTRPNEAMATARDLMNTGLWSPEQIAAQKSWSTAPVASMYEGLKRQLQTRASGLGNPAAYSGGIGRLARDQAYAMGDATNKSSMDIENAIRAARERGIGVLGGFDSDLMARQDAQARANASAASYNAGAGARARDEQASYLRAMTGLMGSAEDLQYGGMQLGGYGAASNNINSRVSETPAWQQMAMGLVPAAANAALGIWGGGGGNKKVNTASGGYGPGPGGEW